MEKGNSLMLNELQREDEEYAMKKREKKTKIFDTVLMSTILLGTSVAVSFVLVVALKS